MRTAPSLLNRHRISGGVLANLIFEKVMHRCPGSSICCANDDSSAIRCFFVLVRDPRFSPAHYRYTRRRLGMGSDRAREDTVRELPRNSLQMIADLFAGFFIGVLFHAHFDAASRSR